MHIRVPTYLHTYSNRSRVTLDTLGAVYQEVVYKVRLKYSKDNTVVLRTPRNHAPHPLPT